MMNVLLFDVRRKNNDPHVRNTDNNMKVLSRTPVG